MSVQLSQHISTLLYHNRYVAIPGFGAFISNPKSATINGSTFQIQPPQKQILFNSEIKNDDGLLVHQIAKTEGLTYEHARLFLDQTVSKWNSDLAKNGEILLDKLGKICLNPHGKLVFSQFSVSNFLIPSYGLEIAKALKINGIKAGAETFGLNSTRPETVVIERLPLSYKRFRTISIGLISLLSVSAVYLYMLSFHPQKIEQAGLNPFNWGVQEHQHQPNQEPVDKFVEFNKDLERIRAKTENIVKDNTRPSNLKKEKEEISTIPDKEVEAQNSQEKPLENDVNSSVGNSISETEKSIKNNSQNTEYHIIVSALDNETKANKAINHYRMKGYEAKSILEANGIYRISLGSFATRDSAETFQKNISNDNNIDGWILIK